MKKGELLIAPDGCCPYLTPFEEYELDRVGAYCIEFGWFVSVKVRHGKVIFGHTIRCPHLRYQNWIIKSEAETEWNNLNTLITLTPAQAERKQYLSKVLNK